jgi:hypothetical protein
MGPEYQRDYVKRLEAALLEYVEKYGPTEAAKAAFREAPQVSGPVGSLESGPDRRWDKGENPND